MPRGMSNATTSLKAGFLWAQELWQYFIPVDKTVFVTTNGQFSVVPSSCTSYHFDQAPPFRRIVAQHTRRTIFFPAITAIEASREDNDAVAYFIVYSQSDVCNQETIFGTFHNEDTEADVDPIKARQRGDGDGLAFRLFNVVKDHNNYFVNEMVAVSNGSQRIRMSVASPSFSS
jgi:hypothetical protein